MVLLNLISFVKRGSCVCFYHPRLLSYVSFCLCDCGVVDIFVIYCCSKHNTTHK